MRVISRNMIIALGGMYIGCAPAIAQSQSPLLADSFRLGSGGGALCQVQARSHDPAASNMFDRAWSIVCRDAARPVGKLYALRGSPTEIDARLAKIRAAETLCSPSGALLIDGLGPTIASNCRLAQVAVGYSVFVKRIGEVSWVAEGLAAYDSALKLGLRSVIANRILPGTISIATSASDDPTSFARVQAGTLDPDQALAEGYRRNNSGNYAEAAEFFDTLQQRAIAPGNDGNEKRGEYLINQGLQKSNLGAFAEADALFAQARKLPTSDRVQTRLRRNFEAMHLLNQQKYSEALARLAEPIAASAPGANLPGSAIEIGSAVAAEINNGLPVSQRLGATESSVLTPEERAIFLDAQALQLNGTLLRLTGQPGAGRTALEKANQDVIGVRDGRVVSVVRLRAQILAETGLAYEDEAQLGAAEAKLRESLALLETRYPQTVALSGARARLAAFLARHGRDQDALSEYRAVVNAIIESHEGATGIGNLLEPYFALLTRRNDPSLAADLFLASQILIRPGVADTQASLSRELSEGTTEASRLFRQARTLEREIERSRIELAGLLSLPSPPRDTISAIETLRRDIAAQQEQQAAAQAQLSGFAQFRAVSTSAISLDALRAALRPGEAYVKLVTAGHGLFALYVDGDFASGYQVPLSPDQLDAMVDGLRDTISKEEAGQRTTYPFDVALAHKLFGALFAPVADRITAAHHVIFEPDGAMLRLPIDLLVTRQQGVDAYLARTADPDADAFDLRGIDWLGRGRSISTAVSPRAFRDARKTAPSQAKQQYLGFGENAPLGSIIRASVTRGAGNGAPNCNWPASEWNKPISARELREAQSVIGVDRSTLVTGRDFTDSAIKSRANLADYRIVHFATHGFVTAPRAECPAQPALLTSFGSGASDGLLSFKEIFDLRMDADLVILSACDTAGKASVIATREAGVTSGGGNALDGLVRAFIGAGSRSVLASHWPAPDDFHATERLIAGLFKAPVGTAAGDALATAQSELMDDPLTSHPYYWAGFAIVGDASQPVLAAR